MSSRAERRVWAVWLLCEALAGANDDEAALPLKKAVERLRPWVPAAADRAMRRVRSGLLELVGESLTADGDNVLTVEARQGYLHMLAALAGDVWRQCPERPAERKRNWRRLNNALADLLTALDPAGEVGVELGCGWADRVEEILRAV